MCCNVGWVFGYHQEKGSRCNVQGANADAEDIAGTLSMEENVREGFDGCLIGICIIAHCCILNNIVGLPNYCRMFPNQKL
uniref:Uncharacterized protein n=1 Tax=Romanomermis culicivorax TaxID=13658 RepID=A0A915K9W5_ROMCU